MSGTLLVMIFAWLISNVLWTTGLIVWVVGCFVGLLWLARLAARQLWRTVEMTMTGTDPAKDVLQLKKSWIV